MYLLATKIQAILFEHNLSDYIVLTFYGYHFHPSKGISGGDISNFVGIPPLLFGDISLIQKISLISIQQKISRCLIYQIIWL